MAKQDMNNLTVTPPRPIAAPAGSRDSQARINELMASVRAGSPLYVINTTNDLPEDSGLRGHTILFTVRDAQQGAVMVSVPATWIPIDISMSADPITVLNNPSFRRFVSVLGYLRIVPEAEAIRILSSPGADTERVRLETSHAQREAAGIDDTINADEALRQREAAMAANLVLPVINNVKSGVLTEARGKASITSLVAAGAVTSEHLVDAIQFSPPNFNQFLAALASQLQDYDASADTAAEPEVTMAQPRPRTATPAAKGAVAAARTATFAPPPQTRKK